MLLVALDGDAPLLPEGMRVDEERTVDDSDAELLDDGTRDAELRAEGDRDTEPQAVSD